jgi:glutamine synthetase
MPNVVLNTAVAESFRQFADRLEKAADFESELSALIKETFTAHRRIIFNGNGYSAEWEEEAARRGLANHRNTAEALPCFIDQK